MEVFILTKEQKTTEVKKKVIKKKQEPKTKEKVLAKQEDSEMTISLAQVQQEAEALDYMETYVVHSDGVANEVVKYYPIFDQKKIGALIQEIQEKIDYTSKNKINYLQSDYDVLEYTHFLIIKYFSHFKDEISDEFEKQYAQMQALISMGYYELFFNEIFNELQVARVLDKLYSFVEAHERAENLQKQALKKVQNLTNLKNHLN